VTSGGRETEFQRRWRLRSNSALSAARPRKAVLEGRYQLSVSIRSVGFTRSPRRSRTMLIKQMFRFPSADRAAGCRGRLARSPQVIRPKRCLQWSPQRTATGLLLLNAEEFQH